MGVMLFTAILYYGGRLVLNNEIALEASAFLGYLGIFYNIINPAKALSTSFSNMRKGAAAINRIEEILKTPVTCNRCFQYFFNTVNGCGSFAHIAERS